MQCAELTTIPAEHWRLVDAALPGVVVGLYLVGSAALGDYQSGRSDIDTITVVARPLTAGDHAALRDVHDALAELFPMVRYDTTYIPIQWLATAHPPHGVTPHSMDGTLRLDQPAGQIHPVQWIEFAAHGVQIAGPTISDLAIAIDRSAANDYVRGNLAGYWASQAESVRSALDREREIDAATLAEAIAWLMLGPPRLAAFLESGAIISKSTAAGWLADRFPEYRDLTQRCLAHRRGEAATFALRDLRSAADVIDLLIRIYPALQN